MTDNPDRPDREADRDRLVRPDRQDQPEDQGSPVDLANPDSREHPGHAGGQTLPQEDEFIEINSQNGLEIGALTKHWGLLL